MGFWIFMFVMLILAPLAMIGVGRYSMKSGPKKINLLFGYRTTMSMKNMETWKFAHHYFGKLWFYTGVILLPFTTLPLFLVIHADEDIIGYFGLILLGIQMIGLLLPIFSTERALRKKFDQNGHLR